MANDFKLHEESALPINRKKKTSTGISGLVIKSGLVKTAGQANAVLILFIILGMCTIVYVNLKTFGV